MVKYNYDAWGNWINKETSGQNKLGNELVNINPFIYKGYIYDEETDFYYLKSRYYSPKIRRFINVDSEIALIAELENSNLFAYCENNPVLYIDEDGHSWSSFWKGLLVVAAVAIIVVSVAATIATCGATSVAGTFAITSAIVILGKATEVAILQGKKSSNDGKTTKQIILDIFESIYNNSYMILLPTMVGKPLGYASGFYLGLDSTLELMKIDGWSWSNLFKASIFQIGERFKNIREISKMQPSVFGAKFAYSIAALQIGFCFITIIDTAPIKRAQERGYSLI